MQIKAAPSILLLNKSVLYVTYFNPPGIRSCIYHLFVVAYIREGRPARLGLSRSGIQCLHSSKDRRYLQKIVCFRLLLSFNVWVDFLIRVLSQKEPWGLRLITA